MNNDQFFKRSYILGKLYLRGLLPIYRVAHLVLNLGWVDLKFDYSTVCLILPGLMGVWQNRLGSWARWGNSQIQVNRTQVRDQMGHPVLSLSLFVLRRDRWLAWQSSQ